MKYKIVLTITIIFKTTLSHSQNSDTIKHSKNSFGFVPILSYDSDIGLRYGVVANFFHYNDTINRKDCYSDNIFLRIFNTTKNSFQTQFLTESDNLIKTSKVFIEASYMRDKSFEFYGFNGTENIYDNSYTNENGSCFLSENFYKSDRTLTRIRFDIQKNIGSPKWRVLGGISYTNYIFQYDTTQSNLLYEFIKAGAITKQEKNGGQSVRFTSGLVYEKRNNQCYCSDGTWAEAYIVFNQNIGTGENFSKLITTIRDYREIGNYVLMTRVSAQTKTHGNIPFYLLSEYHDTRMNQDGLGGAFNLRGIPRARILSDGFILANLELRKNISKTVLFKKKTNIDISVFTDNAFIIQKYNYNNSGFTAYNREKFIRNNRDNYYNTIGAGLYVVMNRNNIINVNYGFSAFQKENSSGLYIGSSFLF
jgi:hypothetical protein